MKNIATLAVMSVLLSACTSRQTPQEEVCDVVVYGATPGGIAAALQATRMGRSVVLLEPSGRIGGLTTGGLGRTDIGDPESFGGIARKFYRDVRAHYAKDSSWTRC